nr:iron-containing alcohol dehydrogenase [Affinibrenneria salicis]
MSAINFSIPREIIYGENAMARLARLSGRKAALVTGGSAMKRNGFLAQAEGLLKQAGIDCMLIDNVEPNPSLHTVQRGADARVRAGLDCRDRRRFGYRCGKGDVVLL